MSEDERPLSVTTDEDELSVKVEDFSKEEIEIAEEFAEKIIEFGQQVTIGRVVMASVAVLLVIFAGFGCWYWVVPRDAVDVETTYFQGGGGHVVMVKVDNSGSRSISDISINIRFKDIEGQVIDTASWQGDKLPAHSSVSGDDLELLVQGYTTWAQYELAVSVEWIDGNGAAHSVNLEYGVGNYTSEWFYDSAPRHYWLI